MGTVYRLPDSADRGGPEDPMLEQRVGRLEDDMKDVKASLKSIEIGLAEIKGRLAQTPTALQIFIAIITTWTAGAAIVFTLLRFASK